MKPYYEDHGITIFHGDCREVLPMLGPVDVTVTDPPYNVGLDYSGGDSRPDYAEWTREWFELTPRPSGLNGWNVWEPVLVYGKHVKPVGHDAWLHHISTGQRSGRDGEAINHPCPKWLPFWTKLILDFSLPGQTVLDPFMGSGTGARACATVGRKFIGIEIEERYCEIAAKRLAQGVLFGSEVA